MAGERLYSEFRDDLGTDWRVSIYDTNAAWNSANATSFVLGSEGFVLKYSGDNEQQHQPIIPSTVEFTLYEEVAAHTQTLDLLYSFDEGRLLLEVYRDPDGDNTIYWRGVILAEQVERADEPFPTAVQLIASDDLGNLKEQDFSRSLAPTGGTGTALGDIVRCLNVARVADLYNSGEAFVRYINDTELYAASDDTDPLNSIIVSVPQRMDDDGNGEPYNCYEILESFATCFNARVFQAEGVFWFWPINVHQRVADAEAISTSVKQYDKDRASVTWGVADITAMNAVYKQQSGTSYTKLAGHKFTHLPPVDEVIRQRRTDGNMYIMSGQDDTIVTTGVNITLADDDRTYDIGTRFQFSGQILFNVSADGAFTFGEQASRVNVEIEFLINADTKYYQPETWTTDSTDRYVLDVGGFDRSNGTNINTNFSFITDELASSEDGLDVTAVVKFFNLEGTNVTSSYTSEDFFLFVAVNYVDGDTGNADLIRFTSQSNSTNVFSIDQGEVLHGDREGFSSQGYFLSDSEWKSSQTTGPISVHRLGVNEALARQRYATKIHRGTVYGLIEMWHTMVEDSEYYVPFEISTVMNRRESTVERYKIAFDSSGITNANDEPRRLGSRGNMLDFINATANTITAQIHQPKLEAGVEPVTPFSGRNTLYRNSLGVGMYHPIRKIDHTSGSTFTIGEKSRGFMFMNGYSGANGFGTIYLPPVEYSEGRLFRFKSDDTISANGYYIIRPDATDATAGTQIDGQASFIMNRDYDGIALICYASEWYVIQRKSK